MASLKNTQTSTLQNLARIALGLFMVFAAIGHLSFQREEFQAQVPNWVPLSKDVVVVLSGIAELILGLAMIFATKIKVKVGIALAVFYVLIFPGNIAQYLNQTPAFGLDTDRSRLIRLFFQPVLILWALWSTGALKALFSKRDSLESNVNFYDLSAKNIRGEAIKMNEFKGKTILIVNTATKCGLAPQFDGLEKLHNSYKDKGLVVLGFPSNQFANQEPADNDSIAQTCSINFGVTFPLFAKIDVNGKDAHPIFKYLKEELGGVVTNDIKWNFTKFLVDKNGRPVKRFAPTTKPAEIDKFIKEIL